MNLVRRIVRRVHALLNAGAIDRDLEREMRAHIDLQALELSRERGIPAAEATRQAAVAFGGVSRFAEEHRDARGVRWTADIVADVRYSLRSLRRTPAFAIFGTLVLALGIGASIAVFSAVDAVLIARLPYPDEHQLVRVYEGDAPTDRWTLSAADAYAIEEHAHTIASFGFARFARLPVRAGQQDAERLAVGRVNAGFIDALGVRLDAGRNIRREDELAGAQPVAVLAHELATSAFGSATAAINSVVTVDGVSHTIIGVLGPSDERLAGWRADLWTALPREVPERRGPFGMFGIARLKPGATVDAARVDLREVSRRISERWGSSAADTLRKVMAMPLRESITGASADPLSLFIGVVVLVLFIAIANVASLSLVRTLRRWREIALRATLGASRGRLIRLIVVENLTLSMVAGVAGVALGWSGLRLLKVVLSAIPRLSDAQIGPRSIALGLAISVFAGLAIALIAAVRLFTHSDEAALRDSARTGDSRHTSRVRSMFVAAEFALALPVLAASALLLSSLIRLQNVNPGFDAHNVMMVRVSVPSATYRDDTERAAFWRRVSENVASIPGVVSHGLGTTTPPDDFGNSNSNFDFADAPVQPGTPEPTASWPSVSTEFFATLGVPLKEGRLFMPSDTGTNPVAVVTESWVRRHSPDRPAIGREINRGGCRTCPRTVVVGIIGDIAIDNVTQPKIAMFSPVTEGWPGQLNLFVKAPGALEPVIAGVRAAIRSTDPAAAASTPVTLENQLSQSIAQPRHWATILVVFAAVSLIMAAIGVFGLLSYAVEMRRREIGVRMALGARTQRVVGAIIVDGMRWTLVGVAAGVVLSAVASRWLRSMLFEVSAVDPLVLASVTTGMVVVALVACWVPARRAARIDPTEAMRGE
jgi:putative ABC transport system permease protein